MVHDSWINMWVFPKANEATVVSHCLLWVNMRVRRENGDNILNTSLNQWICCTMRSSHQYCLFLSLPPPHSLLSIFPKAIDSPFFSRGSYLLILYVQSDVYIAGFRIYRKIKLGPFYLLWLFLLDSLVFWELFDPQAWFTMRKTWAIFR